MQLRPSSSSRPVRPACSSERALSWLSVLDRPWCRMSTRGSAPRSRRSRAPVVRSRWWSRCRGWVPPLARRRWIRTSSGRICGRRRDTLGDGRRRRRRGRVGGEWSRPDGACCGGRSGWAGHGEDPARSDQVGVLECGTVGLPAVVVGLVDLPVAGRRAEMLGGDLGQGVAGGNDDLGAVRGAAVPTPVCCRSAGGASSGRRRVQPTCSTAASVRWVPSGWTRWLLRA